MKTKEDEKLVKIVVVNRFRDKIDHETVYEAGQELEFDEERANDVIERGFAALQIAEG